MKQDIEASVIGGLLIGGLTPTASDVLATLEPEAFSIPLYRKAFEVIRKQARNRNLIDALMVAEACGEEHFTSILMTSKNCPSAANLKGYAGMVADNYHRRLVLEIMDEMREPIQSGTIDASSQAMDELVKRLSAIRKPRDEVKPVRLGEIITDYTDTLDRRLRNGEESDTLKTGIEELDAITGGMNAEDLVIIAARPGMGKTELALKIAEGVASRVIPGSDVRRGVLIFSMEMSALQIAERSIANAGRMSVIYVLSSSLAQMTEQQTLLSHGVATAYVESGVLRIQRDVTTYRKNAYGVADNSYLDSETLHTSAYVLRKLKSVITSKYGRHKLASDGTRFGPGQAIVTPAVIKGELLATYRQLERAGIVENYELFKQYLIVERDASDPNRLNTLFPPDYVNQLRVFAVVNQFRLQYSEESA
ncbi:phage replicative DNA Helicase [Escherichia coli]|uniref:phage tail sheath C-terminal domain-containing protein n=1 Tax=Escherichia coli TaxID=562 RepID=UPI000DA59A08|nr:phage tail sheath C-terminal domain-containing protein [Escherichia coli]SQN42018.1 phage replicative DNA Helicase [Escherichia coli]